MNRGIWKHLPVLFVATTVGLSFYAVKLLLRTSPKPQIQSLNYEMPRPESVERGYDLSGRKIVRTFEDLPKARGAVAKAVDAQTAAKKAADAAKEKARLDAKKKAADASALAAKKKAQAQKEAQRRKAQMAVAIQEQQNKLRPSQIEKPNQAPSQNTPFVQAKEDAPADVRPTANTPAEVAEVLRMSAAQWEARLMAEPTPANGYEFIKSFMKGYVEKAAFYQLSKKLLEDSQANRQQLALYILRQVPNEATFAFLTAEYATTSQDELKLRIYGVLKEYATTANFPVLWKALAAQDVKVVQMSQEIIRVAVVSQNPNPQGGNGRDSRSPGSTPIAPSQFKMFLEPLQKLTGHSDQSVSQRAQTLIERIEALKPV